MPKATVSTVIFKNLKFLKILKIEQKDEIVLFQARIRIDKNKISFCQEFKFLKFEKKLS